jgi:hypothetical protein
MTADAGGGATTMGARGAATMLGAGATLVQPGERRRRGATIQSRGRD